MSICSWEYHAAIKKAASGADGEAQVVEHLPIELKALCSNPTTEKITTKGSSIQLGKASKM
jgi:hypothetical protein